MDPVLFFFGLVYLAGAGCLAAIIRKWHQGGHLHAFMWFVTTLAFALGGYLMYLSFTLPKGA